MSYNLTYTLAFTVPNCETEDGESTPTSQIIEALQQRITELTRKEKWGDALGGPLHVHEVDPLGIKNFEKEIEKKWAEWTKGEG